jgi:hypothetical protein
LTAITLIYWNPRYQSSHLGVKSPPSAGNG